MGDLFKFAKAWALVAMISRLLTAFALFIFIGFAILGDGGKLEVSWQRYGVAYERSE